MSTVPTNEIQKSIFNFAAQSETLRKRFMTVCGQAVRPRKKNAKSAYFNALGYTSIPAARFKESADNSPDTQQLENHAVYAKLFRTIEDGTRDTTFWRTASLL